MKYVTTISGEVEHDVLYMNSTLSANKDIIYHIIIDIEYERYTY